MPAKSHHHRIHHGRNNNNLFAHHRHYHHPTKTTTTTTKIFINILIAVAILLTTPLIPSCQSTDFIRPYPTFLNAARPKFIVQPEDQEVVAGSQVQLRCSGDASPAPMLFWYKEGHRQLMFPQQQQQASPSSLQLQADSTAEWLPQHASLVAPSLTNDFRQGHMSSSDTSPAINKLFTLPLVSDQFLSSPSSSLQTISNNNFFANRIYVDSQGTLNIHNVTPSDGGYYACALTSSVGSALAKAKLTVTQATNSIGSMQADAYDPVNLQAFRSYGPNFNSKYDALPPPVIKFGSANQTLPINTSATLICDVVSIVTYKVLWYFESQLILDNPPKIVLLETGALQIENLTSSDSGIYTCVATAANEQMPIANPYEPLDSSMLTSAPPIQQSTSHSTMLKVASPRNPNFQFFRMLSYEYPSSPGQPNFVSGNGDNAITISWVPPAEPGKNPVKEYIVDHYDTSKEHLGWRTIYRIKGKESLMIDGLSEDGSHFFVIRAANGHGVGPSSGIAGPFRTKLGEAGYLREMSSRGLIPPTPANILTTSNMRPEANLARERLPIITTTLLSAVPVSSKSIRLQWSTQVNGNVSIESPSNYPMVNSADIYNFIEGYSIRYRPIGSAESTLQTRDSYTAASSWNPWSTKDLASPSALPLVTSFLNDEEELIQARNKRDLMNHYDNSQDFSEVRVVDHLTEHYTINGLRPFVVYQFFVVPYYKDIDGVQSNLLTAQTHEDVPSLAPPNLTIMPLNTTSVRLLWSHISPLFANGILRGYSLQVNRSDIMNGQQVEYQGSRADKIMKLPIANLKIGPPSLFSSSDVRNQPFNVGANSYWVMFELTNLTHKSMYSISISAYTNVGLGPWTDNQNFIMDHAALSQIQNDFGEYGNLFSGKDFISYPPQHLENNLRRSLQMSYIYGILVLIVISVLFVVAFAFYRRNNQRVITWRKTISEHFTNKFYMPSTVDPRGPNSIQQNIYDHQQHLLYSGAAHLNQPTQPLWANNNGCVNSSGTGSISSHGGLLPIATHDATNRPIGGEQVLFLNGKDMNTRFIKNQIAGKNVDSRTLNLNPNPVLYGHQGDYYSVINNIAEYEEFDPQARNNMLLINNSETHQTASSNSDTSCPSSVTRLLPNQTHTNNRGPFNKFNDNQRHEMTTQQQVCLTQDGKPAFATMINNDMGRIQPMVQLSPYATTNLMNHGHALVPHGQMQQHQQHHQQLFGNHQHGPTLDQSRNNMNFTLHSGAVMSMDDSAKILRSQQQQHIVNGKQAGPNVFRTLQRNPMNAYHSSADHNQQQHHHNQQQQQQHYQQQIIASNQQPTQVIHQGFYHPQGQYQTSSTATNNSNMDDRSNVYEHVEYSEHMHGQSQISTNADQAHRYHSSQSSNDIVTPSTSSGSLKVLPQKQPTVSGKPPIRQSTIESHDETKEVHDLRVFTSSRSKEMNSTANDCHQLNGFRSSSEENDKNGDLDDAGEADKMIAPRQRSNQQQEPQQSPSQSDNQNKVRGKSGQLSKRKRHQQRNRLHNSLQDQ